MVILLSLQGIEMDTRLRLIQAAHDLRRTVYASLPWGYRLARALFQLRFGGNAEDLGQTAYGIFLLQGVTGMPETPFTPKHQRDFGRLPKNYGAAFGKRVEGVAKKFVGGNKEDLEDLMAFLWTKLLSDTTLRSSVNGKSLEEAEKIVIRSIQNLAKDWLRYEGRRRHDDIDTMIENPSSWDDLGEALPELEKKEIMRDLASIGGGQMKGKLPLYFSLLLEGYSNEEILSQQLLGEDVSMSNAGLAKYRDAIKQVVVKHLADGSN